MASFNDRWCLNSGTERLKIIFVEMRSKSPVILMFDDHTQLKILKPCFNRGVHYYFMFRLTKKVNSCHFYIMY